MSVTRDNDEFGLLSPQKLDKIGKDDYRSSI